MEEIPRKTSCKDPHEPGKVQCITFLAECVAPTPYTILTTNTMHVHGYSRSPDFSPSHRKRKLVTSLGSEHGETVSTSPSDTLVDALGPPSIAAAPHTDKQSRLETHPEQLLTMYPSNTHPGIQAGVTSRDQPAVKREVMDAPRTFPVRYAAQLLINVCKGPQGSSQ